jgi:hypothetical protein
MSPIIFSYMRELALESGRSPSGQALALRVGSIFVVPPLRASILNARRG